MFFKYCVWSCQKNIPRKGSIKLVYNKAIFKNIYFSDYHLLTNWSPWKYFWKLFLPKIFPVKFKEKSFRQPVKMNPPVGIGLTEKHFPNYLDCSYDNHKSLVGVVRENNCFSNLVKNTTFIISNKF